MTPAPGARSARPRWSSPGELAKVTKVLSKAGINIESMYILGTHGNSVDEIAIATDDGVRARDVLSKYL